MYILPLLLFVLPLGLDTLGVSISLGLKSQRHEITRRGKRHLQFPTWLISAILFSLAESLMPLIGLAIGYAASLLVSNVMYIVGPLILIGLGLWELLEEVQESIYRRERERNNTSQYKESLKEPFQTPLVNPKGDYKDPRSYYNDEEERHQQHQFKWKKQLLLALSISLDELAIGFSLGTITVSHSGRSTIQPIVLCILIGIQGFLMTLIGIVLGRTLRTRLRILKEWSELLSAFLLIGLGIWLLV